MAVDGTYGRQNEALDDERAAAMVALDDGREIDRHKRLQTKLPIDFEAIREARERAAEPPDWLEEWPDDEQPPPKPQPWRCARRFEDGTVCGCLQRYPRAAGGYRCDGCGDVTLPAMMGAET